MADRGQDLVLPERVQKEYNANLIAQAICEIRFPTLLELETEQPVAFQKALRKEYPHYEKIVTVVPMIGSSEAEKATGHTFSSLDRRWRVGLKSGSISLDTNQYVNFAEFSGKLYWIVKQIDHLLDTPRYTRVGLRYINALPVGPSQLDGWINESLGAPLLQGIFGRPTLCWQQIRGTCGKGSGFMFQHGLDPNVTVDQKKYFLDSDFFAEDVENGQLRDMLSHFHEQTYRLFEWAIGDRAREHMSKSPDGRKD